MPPKKKSADEITDEKSDVKGKRDDRFRKVFVIQVQGTSLEDLKAYAEQDIGNKQATVQEALNRGVHPKGEPRCDDVEIIHEGISSATAKFTYSVVAVPASLDLDPASTIEPRDIDAPVRREDDKRESVRQSRLRAASDPAGFAE